MDLVLMGGNVLTIDRHDSRAEAVGVKGGKITAVGTNAEVSKLAGPDTQIVRLAGRTLIPGFVYPHNHFSMNMFDHVSVDCRVPLHNSIGSILNAVSAAARGAPRGEWIRGFGFRSWLVKESRPTTRWELDEAAPENPVCIMDYSVHAYYVNSAVLRLAGIDRDAPDPPHGRILRDDRGEPNGTLWESAMNDVYHLSLRTYLDHHRDSVADLVHHNCMRHIALGITSVGDAVVMPEAGEMYRLADSNRKLPMVVHQMLGGERLYSPPDRVWKGEGGDGNVSGRLRGGTVKIFMDPIYPSSAFLKYDDGVGVEHQGERFYTQEEVDSLVLDARRNGLQVAIHCLGNWALKQALIAFERAQREHPVSEPRFRVEHFTLSDLSQIRRAQSMGVVACVQPGFVLPAGDVIAEEMGGNAQWLPLRTMLSEGMTVAASSDSPCAPLDPLLGLYSMVTRRTWEGEGPVSPEEAVTPMEGLRMYTLSAAYAMSRENEVGSIERGKRADMVVLSHDPTAVDPNFIREIAVEQTYVDGQLLYQR